MNAVTLCAGSWLIADTVNAMVEGGIAAPVETPPSPPPIAPALPRSPDELLASLRRNIFDHGEPIPGEEPTIVVAKPSACDADVDVVSAVLDRSDARRSLATIRQGAAVRVVQVGDAIGDATVAAVGVIDDESTLQPAAALLLAQAGGRIEVCRSRGDVPGSPTTVGVPSASGVRMIDELHYEITRQAVNDAVGPGMQSLAQGVRVVPYFEGGEQKGFKLYAIEPGSLLASIGLRNGDVLQHVDGYDVSNPEQALRVYELLKTERDLTVGVSRNGASTTLSYSIR